ncbi:zinc ribbon domain-containing protein [Ligilactobacillus animalis]|uniref:Zinc ribbon domain-containing protein n=1 Tax=Ligilactobacillus animalis TaxID=1605 RepID=A0AAJ6K4N3_9LACO|nr:zinc ribbon domain-containing protein [Ligilactobacillus animalis]WHQ79898.1 zinc ribbon domain-containing protein [Ligilactobacillus animalis]
MQCPNCGKDNLPGAQFCENCGQSLSASQQTFIQPIPPKKNNAGKYILGVFIGLFLSLIAVGAITLVHNTLAQRPVKTSAKLKTEVYKYKDSSEDDSSTQEDASSDDDVDSSDEQEVDQDAPITVVANGQTTTWVSDDGPVLTINGTTTVTISNGSKAPEDGTYDIKGIENNGEKFYIARGPASMGEISIVDNVLTVNNQGQITTYHYQPESKEDNTESSSYDDDDNIYEAD